MRLGRARNPAGAGFLDDPSAFALESGDQRLAAGEIGLDARWYGVAEYRVAAQRGEENIGVGEVARHSLRRPVTEHMEVLQATVRHLLLHPGKHAAVAEDDPLDAGFVS